MKAKKIISVFLSAVMFFSCLPLTVSAEQTVEPEYVEGEIVISSTKDIEDSFGLLNTASAADPDVVEIDFEEEGITDIEEVENYSEEDKMYIAEVDGDIEKICEELNKNGDIIAEPNYIAYTFGFTMPEEITNPAPYYTAYQKWYLDWVLDFPETLQAHEVTGEGVTVAVIDNGFFINAPDFPANLWRNSGGTVGWNVSADNDDISPVLKSNGTLFEESAHGSNVAGIIGMTPNGMGGIGAAYGAELMLLKVSGYTNDNKGERITIKTADITKAINYAVQNGADVINLSLGTYVYPSTMKTALDKAYDKGIAVFAAAGNGDENRVGYSTDSNICYPAGFDNVIGVVALDSLSSEYGELKLTDFSNYDVSGSTYYNIAVPGREILGCGATSESYTLNNGTSQSSPLAAAAAALYLEKYPGTSVQKLYSDMLASSTETARTFYDSSYRYKVLNIKNFLDYSSPPVIKANLFTDATIDGNYFYGLNEGFEDINNYVSVTNGTMTFVPSANGNGTGSTIKVYKTNGVLYKTLTVVVFGDINGDSYADAQDAVFVKCIEAGLGRYSSAQRMAGDVTLDTLCDSLDAELIENYAIMLDYISQTV